MRNTASAAMSTETRAVCHTNTHDTTSMGICANSGSGHTLVGDYCSGATGTEGARALFLNSATKPYKDPAYPMSHGLLYSVLHFHFHFHGGGPINHHESHHLYPC